MEEDEGNAVRYQMNRGPGWLPDTALAIIAQRFPFHSFLG